MTELFANSGDPDQTPHSAASDLGLHCLPVTILLVSRLQWVNLCRKQDLIFHANSPMENKENITNLLSDELAQRVIKVKILLKHFQC